MSNISRIGRRKKRPPKFYIDDTRLLADYAKNAEEAQAKADEEEAASKADPGDPATDAYILGELMGRAQVYRELRDGLRKAMAGKPS